MKDEILSLISRPVSWMKPLRLAPQDAWVGHIPFAYWLIEAAAPRLLVELATHTGSSYLAFLQAIDELKLNTQCFGIDTWRGGEHAGSNNDRTCEDLEKFHDARYQAFSRLVRLASNETLPRFNDGSVDILHLGGSNTYDAVRGDFESWLPKLSERGIVLLHDINARENHVGASKLWNELRETCLHFSFPHGDGLGVILAGKALPDRVKRLHQLTIARDGTALQLMRAYFGALGDGLLNRYESAQVPPLLPVNTARQEQFPDVAHRQRPSTHVDSEVEVRQQLSDSNQQQLGLQTLLASALEELRGHRQRSESLRVEIHRLHEQSGRYEKALAEAREKYTDSLRQIKEVQLQLDASIPALQQVRDQSARYENDFVEFQIRFADSVQEREEIRRHFDAALSELQFHRNRTPDYDTLHAAAKGWRREAIDAYCDKIEQWRTKIAKSPYGAGASVPARAFNGRIQRIYSAGYHQLARLLLILRHPRWREIRWFRFGAIVRKHEDTIALVNLLSSESHEIPIGTVFDRGFYLRNNPDVKAAGLEPHVHYATHGADEDRQPHPMFDSRYYRKSAAAVGEIVGSDALLHYIKHGGKLRIDPHPYFYSEFYLDQVGDDVDRIDHPLFHYLLVGERLGLHPNPEFDPAWYLSAYADVSAEGLSPLQHYVEFGRAEGRFTDAERCRGQIHSQLIQQGAAPTPRVFRPDQFAPTGGVETVAPGNKVDVVIPVYGGAAETKRCIERVIKSASENRTLDRIVIVDDCGPNPAVRTVLDALADNPLIVLVRNRKNLGFVESVNKGMSVSDSNDVILLNSDTEVVGNWIDRLAVQAYAAGDIGSVTPFSNNATICSYPSLPGRSDLPKGQTVETLDNAFRIANAARSVDLPTAVGFCMYIKRTCLDQIGLFDAETFGKGYGEENDFCLRSAKRGWRHILAGDVFVYHVGEVSFSENSKKAKEFAWQLLTSRYPEYAASVARFVERDPLAPLRGAASAVLYQTSGVPVVLHLTHRLGGGTAKHVYSLTNLGNEKVRQLVLEISASEGRFSGKLVDIGTELDLEFEAESVAEIADMLKTFGVSRVHVHHVYAFADHVEELLKRLSLPYDLTIHDYMLICPRINLMSPDGKYCGEPAESGCLACLSAAPISAHPDIIWWRLQRESLAFGAERVICPSQDVANRMARYLSSNNLIVVPHEIIPASRPTVVPGLHPGEPLRIAALGIMARHKGGAFLVDCAQNCKLAGLKVEMVVIGNFDDPILARAARDAGIRSTGQYDDSDLQRLIAQEDPHLIFYPQRWPETFSYTLSAGLISGRPLLAPIIGAFPERLAGHDWTWTYELQETASEIAARLEVIRQRILAEGPIEMTLDNAGPVPLNSFYQSAYETSVN
jgi:GT2 family glycosyltransferase